jgi:hypothetical protein
MDERRQRALTRYYLAAGAGGLAIGVHTTQFAIHDPKVGLYEPVLTLAAETIEECEHRGAVPVVRVAGIVGDTQKAVSEATLAADLGFHVGLVDLRHTAGGTDDRAIEHLRAVAEIIPVMGFYLQPAVGGHDLPYRFWRRVAELDRLVAVKVAPFDRYRTLEVVRAVVDAGRGHKIALYTGNDDHIVLDLVTPFRFGDGPEIHMVGGLLGQWAVWTNRATELHAECRLLVTRGRPISPRLLTVATQLTDANGAIFDAKHGYAGCIPGIHEILRRQGLLAGTWTLNPGEVLSPGQSADIARVLSAYPDLTDDAFVAEHRDRWLA